MNKMEAFKETFWKLVSESEHILVTSHISPDEDSFSSVLVMYALLQEKMPGKHVRIAYTGEAVPRFSSFLNFDKIEFVDDVANLVSEVDLLIMLDGGEYHRFSKMPEQLQTAKKTIAIDHHASAPGTFSASLIDTNMTSTSELLYRLFASDMNISKEIAETFLLGMLGDTGNFAFVKPAQGEIFTIAQKLLQTADTSIEILQSRYRAMSQREFALIQLFMKNTSYTEIPNWPAVQYSFITEDEVKAGAYSEVEISAGSAMYIGKYLRSVSGYPWGFVATPKDEGCKFSFRSMPGSVNVRDMVERIGIGGGHDRAAGAAFKKTDVPVSVEQGIQNMFDWMKANKPELN